MHEFFQRSDRAPAGAEDRLQNVLEANEHRPSTLTQPGLPRSACLPFRLLCLLKCHTALWNIPLLLSARLSSVPQLRFDGFSAESSWFSRGERGGRRGTGAKRKYLAAAWIILPHFLLAVECHFRTCTHIESEGRVRRTSFLPHTPALLASGNNGMLSDWHWGPGSEA